MSMNTVNSITLAGVIGAAALACTGIVGQLDSREHSPEGPHVEFEVTDGVRTLNRVLRQPSLVMTLRGADSGATYGGRLRVGNAPEREIRHIWNDVPRDLSGELLSLSAFGKARVQGYLFDEASPSERIPFEVTVWMEYAGAELADVSLRMGETLIPLSGGAALAKGDYGELLATYAPSDTYLHIGVETDQDGPLLFSPEMATNRSGRFCVPFYVRSEGEASLTLALTGGRDTTRTTYRVSCTDNLDH